MTISRVGTDNVVGTPNTQTNLSLVTSHTSVPAVDDLVIIEACLISPGTGTTQNFNTPAGWTSVGTALDAGTPSLRFTVFQKKWVNGDTFPTLSWGTQAEALAVVKIRRGVDTTTPFHQSSVVVHSGTATARTTGTITTTISSVIEYAFCDRSGSTFTKGTGTDDTLASLIHSASLSIASFAVPTVVAAGSVTKTATASVSSSIGASGIYALAPAATPPFEGWGAPI